MSAVNSDRSGRQDGGNLGASRNPAADSGAATSRKTKLTTSKKAQLTGFFGNWFNPLAISRR
jgi:hypothetical protein